MKALGIFCIISGVVALVTVVGSSPLLALLAAVFWIGLGVFCLKQVSHANRSETQKLMASLPVYQPQQQPQRKPEMEEVTDE